MTIRVLIITSLFFCCGCGEVSENSEKANVEKQYDPWPKKTEKIEVLTVERAAELASLRPSGIYDLHLSGLKSIDKDVAHELAEFEGNLLSLRGLPSLDTETAHELSRFKGAELNLDGLTSIDKGVARELVKIKGSLDLNGLISIDKETALVLAKWNGKFLKIGAKSIGDGGVRPLAENMRIWLLPEFRGLKR